MFHLVSGMYTNYNESLFLCFQNAEFSNKYVPGKRTINYPTTSCLARNQMTAAYFQFINYKTHEEVRKIVILFLNTLPTFLKNLFSKSNEICIKNRLYQWLTGGVVRCGKTFSMKQIDYIFSLFDTPDCCKCHKCAV